jgi:DNA-binding SARP family transcriptional activator
MAIVIEARTHPPDSRGLRRERLDVLLSQIPGHQLALVTAPAGSGKTTALAQFAANATVRVAWYSVDSLDGTPDIFFEYLRRAIGHVAGEIGDEPWTSYLDVLHHLEGLGPEQLVIVLDDFHLIAGQPAEALVAQILRQLPPNVRVAIGSRLPPGFDITQLRLTGNVLEIDADDLRFRTWEAEHLLDETYGMLLRPDDVARLTRQVAGWAAGFQLFHLAARGKSPPEQRRLIRTASTRSVLARQYLTQNVLGSLPAALREFLIHTSVLGVVRGDLADDLLDRNGSDADLERVERYGLFVVRVDDTTYRYHEVLRAHLEAVLAEALPADELNERYVRAAQLLEGAGYPGEAVRCYVRSGQRDEVSRLAGLACTEPSITTTGWLDVLDDAVTPESGGDPWISLAQARGEVAAGRFNRARAHYRRAQDLFGDSDVASTCRHERITLDSFGDPLNPPPTGWLGELHRGLHDDPIGAAFDLASRGTAEASVASGALLFLAGRVDEAADRFDAALMSEDLPDWAVDAGRLGRQLIRLLQQPADPTATLALIDRLTGSLGNVWFERFAQAVVAMSSDTIPADEAVRVAERCQVDGDPWGAAFGFLCAGIATADEPALAEQLFERALEIADQQRSLVIASSAHGGLAKVVQGAAGDRHAVLARRLAHKIGLDQPPSDAFFELVAPHRNTDRPSAPASHLPSIPEMPTVVLRCFGEFQVMPGGPEIEQLKPRPREVLMRLALEIGRPIHRDRLIGDLWSGIDETSATRSLQVAVSAIRKALDATASPFTIERVDGGYQLSQPSTGVCDLVEFGRRAEDFDRTAHDLDTRLTAAESALGLFAGELLPGAGSAEWVLGERERLRLLAARLARRSAKLALDHDQSEIAIRLARSGIEFDRFDDGLWRIAIDAHRASGDEGSAERLRRAYHQMLEELGVSAKQ